MFAFVAAILLSACSSRGGIQVAEAWMRPAGSGENGAVYLIIHNDSSADDELTGVLTEAAEAAEMHTSQMNGDVMQMQQLESVPLPASAATRFEPGGLHIMLVGLKKDLKVGNKIEITLQFQNAEDLTLSVPVSDMPVQEEGH
jgi:periplasmic copper chaperone A